MIITSYSMKYMLRDVICYKFIKFAVAVKHVSDTGKPLVDKVKMHLGISIGSI